MSRPASVLIVEGGMLGHWLQYVGYLVDRAHAAGFDVHVALDGAAVDSDQFRMTLGGRGGRMQVHRLEVFTLEGAEAIAGELGVSLVVLPSADRFLPAMVRPGRFGRASISLLLMRTRWQRDAGLRGAVRTALKAGCIVLLGLRRRVRVFGLRSALDPSPGPLLRLPRRIAGTVPDPATFAASPETTVALREAWGLTPDVRWFGIFGAISSRKNVAAIVDALRLDGTGRYGLVVAGLFEEDVAAEAQTWQEDDRVRLRLVIDDRVLTDAEFDSAFLAVDAVVIAHSNEGPSGVLGKAALSGTPVLAAGAQSLRREALQHPRLAHWVPLAPEDLLRGLERVSTLERPPQQLPPTTARFTDALLQIEEPGRAVAAARHRPDPGTSTAER